ncbi:MAG TPA: hypothetical protein DIS66_01205, partial [Candidatus Omnitrophica bacterium]|nr:hypothetical protein [Candidatus Omnitrophota bacterium]
MKTKISRLHKIAATATALCVAFTQIAVAAPAFSVSAREVSLPDTLRLDQAMQISVPSAVATVDKLIPGNGKTIFHIQTAHGQYQAEKQIEFLLAHLEKNYGVETLLMEGASEALNPEIINFFPEDRKSTLEVVDAFVRHSVISGPEVFLLNSGKAQGLGIEDEAVYEQNLQDFVSVVNARDAGGQFLSNLEIGIERLAALYLSSDARSFLKQVERKETGDVPFDIYLQQLRLAAEKYAGINLADASWQLLWPMLTRIFTIEKLEKKIDAAAFKKQKEDFLKAVKPYTSKAFDAHDSLYTEVEKLLNLKDLSARLPDPETSALFEALVRALPDNFNYGRFSSVTAFCGLLMLKSQLQIETLSDEITRMEDKIADRLAETKNAKALVSILKDYRLLKKLFALELLPADFDKLMGPVSGETRGLTPMASNDVRPSALVKQVQQLNGNSRAKEVEFKNVAELDALYTLAVRFYEGARLRDTKMLERIEEHLDATGADKVAVVTGGFHSGPFAEYFEKRGYNYALMTPKLTTIDTQGRQNYLDVMQMWVAAPKNAASFNAGSISGSTIQPKPATPGILMRLASRVLNSFLFGRFRDVYVPRFAKAAMIPGVALMSPDAVAQTPATPPAPAPLVVPAKVPVPVMNQVDRNEKTRIFDLLKKRPTGNDEKKALMVQEQIQLIQSVSPAILLGNLSETLGLLTVIKESTLRAALIGRLASFLNQYQLDPKQINEMMSAFLKIFSDPKEDVAVRSAAGQAILQGLSNFDFPSNVDSALVRSLTALFSSSKEDVSIRLLALQILASLVSEKNLTPLPASDLKIVASAVLDALEQTKDKSYSLLLPGFKMLLERVDANPLLSADDKIKVVAGIAFAGKKNTEFRMMELNEKLRLIVIPDNRDRQKILLEVYYFVANNSPSAEEKARILSVIGSWVFNPMDKGDFGGTKPLAIRILEGLGVESLQTLEKLSVNPASPKDVRDDAQRTVGRLKVAPARSEARSEARGEQGLFRRQFLQQAPAGFFSVVTLGQRFAAALFGGLILTTADIFAQSTIPEISNDEKEVADKLIAALAQETPRMVVPKDQEKPTPAEFNDMRKREGVVALKLQALEDIGLRSWGPRLYQGVVTVAFADSEDIQVRRKALELLKNFYVKYPALPDAFTRTYSSFLFNESKFYYRDGKVITELQEARIELIRQILITAVDPAITGPAGRILALDNKQKKDAEAARLEAEKKEIQDMVSIVVVGKVYAAFNEARATLRKMLLSSETPQHIRDEALKLFAAFSKGLPEGHQYGPSILASMPDWVEGYVSHTEDRKKLEAVKSYYDGFLKTTYAKNSQGSTLTKAQKDRIEGLPALIDAAIANARSEARLQIGKDFILSQDTNDGWTASRYDAEFAHRSLNQGDHNVTVSLVTQGNLRLVEGSFEVSLMKGQEGADRKSIAKIYWDQETDKLNVSGQG